MKILAFDIPDDLDRVPEWLESHLLGLELDQFVSELSVLTVTTANEQQTTLADVLADKTDEVLRVGLRSLTRPQLRQLLRQPQLLLQLQQKVIDEGGAYWTSIPHNDETRTNTTRTWRRLKTTLADEKPTPVKTAGRTAWIWAGAGWLTAVAAVVALSIIHWDRVEQLQRRIIEQAAAAQLKDAELQQVRATARKEQERAIAAARIRPGDLPGEMEGSAVAVDPNDLPSDDPPDLPDGN